MKKIFILPIAIILISIGIKSASASTLEFELGSSIGNFDASVYQCTSIQHFIIAQGYTYQYSSALVFAIDKIGINRNSGAGSIEIYINGISKGSATISGNYADFSSQEILLANTDYFQIMLNISNFGNLQVGTTVGGSDSCNSTGGEHFYDDTSHGIYTAIYSNPINFNSSTSSLSFDFSLGTTTPGLGNFSNPNATSALGWIDSIWNTSSSAFYVDCSGNDGGIFSSSTLNAIGCFLRKSASGLLGMIVVPPPSISNYLGYSFNEVKNVFPFKMVFDAINTVSSTISSVSTSTQSLSIPIYGHGNFEVLSSSTLDKVMGTDMKNQVFAVIKSIIWLGTGIILITLW